MYKHYQNRQPVSSSQFNYYGILFDYSTLDLENFVYYTYVLIDPRDDSPFYVRKGKGGRVQDHLRGHSHNKFVKNKIKKILSLGLEVKVKYLREGVNELQAFMTEVLNTFILGNKFELCNIMLPGPFGNSSGFKHSEETIEKIRSSSLNRRPSEEVRTKLRYYALYERTNEHKERITESNLQRHSMSSGIIKEIREFYLYRTELSFGEICTHFNLPDYRVRSIIYGVSFSLIHPELIPTKEQISSLKKIRKSLVSRRNTQKYWDNLIQQ